MNYILQLDRVDFILDVYKKDSIKQQLRVKRWASVNETGNKRRRVVGHAKVHKNMSDFLKQVKQ